MLFIPLLKTVDFTAAMKLVILFGFQNGGLNGPNRSQSFDFQIAIIFLFLLDFDQVYGRLQNLMRACLSDSLVSMLLFPLRTIHNWNTREDFRALI